MSTREIRKRNRKINNALVIALIATFLLTIIAFAVNIVRISKKETGEGETIETEVEPVEVGNEYSNDYYSIGYNATEVNKEYFRQLDEAVEAETPVKTDIASALVKSFVAEYYTWTNKDGNYDIGGMQYIYTDRRADFEKYSRYGFYADMDLYLKQYDRSELYGGKTIQRSDDNPETVQSRLDTYRKNTAPLIDFYAARGLIVEGNNNVSSETCIKEIEDGLAKLGL